MSTIVSRHVTKGIGTWHMQAASVQDNSREWDHGHRLAGGLSTLWPMALRRNDRRKSHQVKSRPVTCSKLPRKHREQRDIPYHVMVVTPPPRKLGVHRMPMNVHCGETLTLEDQFYVVSGVSYRYKLSRGRYEFNSRESTLEVQQTSRYILNTYLDNLLEKT